MNPRSDKDKFEKLETEVGTSSLEQRCQGSDKSDKTDLHGVDLPSGLVLID
jgi:hypothetical protein